MSEVGMTVSTELAMALFESGVRISQIWCLAALSDAIPQSFRDHFEDNPQLPEEFAWLPAFDGSEDDLYWDDFLSTCADKGLYGFVIVAECPVYTASSARSASCSWGHYRSQTMYAASIEIGLSAAMNWAKGQFSNAVANYSPPVKS